MSADAAAALARTLSTHGDDIIQQAIMLLVSQRPALHELLLDALQEPPAQRFTGAIKAFWPEKQYGLIDCDEIKEEFGADVFFSEEELGPFDVGSMVTFSVMLTDTGRPQAMLLEASMEAPPTKRRAVVPPPIRQPPPSAPAKRMRTDQPPPWRATEPVNDEEELYVGMIKSFRKHYGFIACEAFKASRNCDVFLSDHEILDFNVGDWVAFSVEYNRNGQPQAHRLRAASGPDLA